MTSRQSKTGSTLAKQRQLLRQQALLHQQFLQLQPQTKWFWVKGLFLHSETILLSRITVLTGFITAVIGALDWSPLLGLDIGTGFNQKQIMWLGGIMVAQGIGVELARRRKADVDE